MAKGLEIEKIEPEEHKKPAGFAYTTAYFKKKYTQMDTVFNNILPDLKELSEYFLPAACKFLVDDVNKARKKPTKILDSISITAVNNFASGMQSGATSAASSWYSLRLRDREANVENDVKIWCSQTEELIRRILLGSNFYQSLLHAYKQLGVFGFSCMQMESDYMNIANFKVLPIGSYRYSKDFRGEVDTVCRKYLETAENIVKKYGYENCSESVKNAYDTNSDKRFEIVHFVESNKEYNKKSPLSKYKKYISATFESSSTKFLKLSGFDKFPFAVFESEVNGEDNYPSNCPGIQALPDVKQLNKQIKVYSTCLKKLAMPLMKGPASVANQKGITDSPGVIIPEDETGRGISPVYEINPRVLELKQHNDELKETIKTHFYNDLFAVILNTAERGRTATEVNELKEEKMVLLSPLLDQIHKGLRTILEWIFFETFKFGIMPEPPEIIENKEIKIEFISSLALAQKVKKISAIERFTTFVSNLANSLDPVLRAKLKGDKIIEDYAEIANVNPEYVISEDELNKKRAEIAQKEQEQEQMAKIQQTAGLIKNMGGIDSIGGDMATRMGIN